MRQLIVSSSPESASQVQELAREYDCKHLFQVESRSGTEPKTTSFLNLHNRDVEHFLNSLEGNVETDITLLPRPIVTLHSPFGEEPSGALDPQTRSPFEVFQEGLQSIGSTTGMIGYSILAGVVVWVGLYTNSVALQVAAMLIAPFAGPAMNVALSNARGDRVLLLRALLRYTGAVFITILVCCLLSLAVRQQHATSQMLFNGKISSYVLLLPLAAGAAGALNLVQSQRDSLVSGAAVGVLVAAALAPPAGNLGMSIAIGAAPLAWNSCYILVLQLLAINLAGTLLFRWYGISPTQALYKRGNNLVFGLGLAVTVAALAGLLAVQFSFGPELQRSSREQEMVARVRRVLQESESVHPLKVHVDFLPTDDKLQHPVLVTATCLRTAPKEAAVLRADLGKAIDESLREQIPGLTPLINVQLVDRPLKLEL